MKKQTSLFKNLWITAESSGQAPKVSQEEEIISKFIFEADLCEDLESYVALLCDGMYRYLGVEKLKSVIALDSKLRDKIERLGLDIMEKSRYESDLYYVGIFADLKLSQNWLNRELYRVLSGLFGQVLSTGLKISNPLRIRLQKKWRALKRLHTSSYQELKYSS